MTEIPIHEADMAHTYLLREGTWIGAGTFFDANGSILPVEGEYTVAHGQFSWTINSWMRVSGSDNMFKNDYEVVPFSEQTRTTKWVSDNPALGSMTGIFSIVHDTIFSVFSSDDGRFTGSETLVITPEGTYQNRGVLFAGDIRVSSWVIELSPGEMPT